MASPRAKLLASPRGKKKDDDDDDDDDEEGVEEYKHSVLAAHAQQRMHEKHEEDA